MGSEIPRCNLFWKSEFTLTKVFHAHLLTVRISWKRYLGCKGKSTHQSTTHGLVVYLSNLWGFPGGSDGKASAYSVGDLGLISGLGRSPGKGNGNPLQYSCLENSMDWGAWWATVHGVAKSPTWLSDFTHSWLFYCMILWIQQTYLLFFFFFLIFHIPSKRKWEFMQKYFWLVLLVCKHLRWSIAVRKFSSDEDTNLP